MSKIVLSLCDYTGNIVKPWAENGYTCYIVDILHKETNFENNIHKIKADINNFIFDLPIYIAFAFPPCTELASSGSRWWINKDKQLLINSLKLVKNCRKIITKANIWCLENPIGRLPKYWRKYNYTFDPCDYAGYANDPYEESYTKKTCLWTSDNFKMPELNYRIPILKSKMHTDIRNPLLRSETPTGFAKAVYLANIK